MELSARVIAEDKLHKRHVTERCRAVLIPVCMTCPASEVMVGIGVVLVQQWDINGSAIIIVSLLIARVKGEHHRLEGLALLSSLRLQSHILPQEGAIFSVKSERLHSSGLCNFIFQLQGAFPARVDKQLVVCAGGT